MPKHSLTIFRLIISCNHIVNLVFSSGVCKVFVKTEQSRKEIENKNHAKQAQRRLHIICISMLQPDFPE